VSTRLGSPLARTLLAGALANSGAAAVLVLRNLLDGYYAAQLSAEAMAALTLTVPVSLLLIGLSQGISVVTANRIAVGSKNPRHDDAALISHASLAALLYGTVSAVLLWMLFPLLISAYGTDLRLVPRATAVGGGILASAPLLFLFGTLTATLRGLGSAAGAARATVVGLGLGAAASALFMLGAVPWFSQEPLLGIPAGLALGYGAAISIAACELRELRRQNVCRGQFALQQGACVTAGIARAAMPIVANNLVGLAAMFVVFGMAARAGVETTAAFGTVYRIEQFGMIALNGIVLAIAPLAARHWNERDKLRELVATGLALQLALCVVLGGALALGAGPISRVFDLPAPASALVVTWLGYLSVSLFFQGVTLTCTVLLQIRRPANALLLTGLRLYGCLLPLLWLITPHAPAAVYPLMCCVQVVSGGAWLAFLWRTRQAGSGARAPADVTAT